MAEYETYIIEDISELREGEEVTLNIRDREMFEPRVVKAIISSSPENLPGADTLWLRWQRGQLVPKPWAIKITQELGSEVEYRKVYSE